MDDPYVAAALAALEGSLRVVEVLGAATTSKLADPEVAERLGEVRARVDLLLEGSPMSCAATEDVRLGVEDDGGDGGGVTRGKGLQKQATVAKLLLTEQIKLGAHTLSQRTVQGVHLRAGVLMAQGRYVLRSAIHFPPLMIRPGSTFRTTWDMCTAILLVYVAAVEPYAYAFMADASPTPLSRNMNLFVDCFFLVDLVLNFRTGYVDHASEEILDPWKAAAHYGKGWFLCRKQPVEWTRPAKLQTSLPRSFRLIFGRIVFSRRVLEARPKSLVRTVRLRAH